MSVRVVDHGADALIKRLGAKALVDVGVDSSRPHPASYEPGGPPSIDALALIHEFGSGCIPARSFIRGWVDEQQQTQIADRLRAFAVKLEMGAPAVEAAKELGAWLTADCLARFDAGIPPPLSPVTVAKKGHDTILVETGTLRAALSYIATVIKTVQAVGNG